MERICIKCGQEMQPIKNGFLFAIGTEVMTSDLWGCRTCRRFQIHGCPDKVALDVGILLSGAKIPDPGNPKDFIAFTDPELELPESFNLHMKEYYPHWNWEGGKEQ